MSVELFGNAPVGELIARLGWTLIHFLWQGALVGAAAWVSLGMLRHASPRLRYNLAGVFFLAMGAAPVLTFLALGQTPATPLSSTVIQDSVSAVAAAPASASTADWSHRITNLTPWVVLAWAVGVGIFVTRLALGYRRVSLLKVRGLGDAPALWHETLERLIERLGIERPIRIATSVLVKVPTVVGPFRPVILMPASLATGLSHQQIEMILAHELAHIRRHDLVFNLVQVTIEALLFFHPAVHRLAARIRVEREKCCDDMAVEICGEPVTYATTLAALEEFRQRDLRFGLAATGGQLLDRVQRLVAGSRRPQRGGALLGVVATMAAAAATTITVQDRFFPGENREVPVRSDPAPLHDDGDTPGATPTADDNVDDGSGTVPTLPEPALRTREDLSNKPGTTETSAPDNGNMTPDTARDDDSGSSGGTPKPDATAETGRPPSERSTPAPEKTNTSGTGDAESAAEEPSPSPRTASAEDSGSGSRPGAGPDIGKQAAERPAGGKSNAPGKDKQTARNPSATGSPETETVSGGDIIHSAQPEYPRRMLRRGSEGRVVVEFTVTENGNVSDVTIDGEAPDAGFEEAARQAITQWQFEPFRVDGRRVERRLSREFVFELGAEAESGANCRQTGSRINRC